MNSGWRIGLLFTTPPCAYFDLLLSLCFQWSSGGLGTGGVGSSLMIPSGTAFYFLIGAPLALDLTTSTSRL